MTNKIDELFLTLREGLGCVETKGLKRFKIMLRKYGYAIYPYIKIYIIYPLPVLGKMYQKRVERLEKIEKKRLDEIMEKMRRNRITSSGNYLS